MANQEIKSFLGVLKDISPDYILTLERDKKQLSFILPVECQAKIQTKKICQNNIYTIYYNPIRGPVYFGYLPAENIIKIESMGGKIIFERRK